MLTYWHLYVGPACYRNECLRQFISRDLLVRIGEARTGSQGSTITDLMLLDVASVFQSRLRYQSHQSFGNDKWMEAYVRLRKHIESGRSQQYSDRGSNGAG